MVTTKAMLVSALSIFPLQGTLAAVLPSSDVSMVEGSGDVIEHANTALGKRAAPGNETDTELYKTMSWYWAGSKWNVLSRVTCGAC